MAYIRGNRADYDEWAAIGAEGWGYDDVLPDASDTAASRLNR